MNKFYMYNVELKKLDRIENILREFMYIQFKKG